jgi:hypothetical protein
VNLNELKEEIAKYERLLERKACFLAIQAENRLTWEITTTVRMNGKEMQVSIPVGKAAVDNLLNNRINALTADIDASKLLLGITP